MRSSRCFTTLMDTARRFDIPFPLDSALVAATSPPFSVPLVDAGILDALITVPKLGISGTLRAFRGPISKDPRPNRALRPWLYEVHSATYPQLRLLCTIATDGIAPPWVNPDARCGVRPLPDNYGGAESGAPLFIDKLLADYYKGRCLVATLATLQRDPGFHSSSFALVAKKDIPLHIDGRIIHDLSAPPGGSVNVQTNSDASPNATWNPFDSIAQRVRDLCRRYPGYAIYAMVVDIADAFHHVPVHADHASAFGERMPRSNHGIVSGMAVFGWTSSPGFFAVFGKAVRHYQRTGASSVLGYSEPFWIFQWVDDIVLIEVDIGERLQKAEQRLRDGVKLVFGSAGWHEGKFTTWSRCFHAVSIDWDIPNELISVPQRKIKKMRGILDDVARRKFVTMKQLDSLVGVLRHVISFIPVTKHFIQRLVTIQIKCRKRHKAGVPMMDALQKDIQWWRELVFQNEFAGIPMELFECRAHIDDVWLVQIQQHRLTISSMVLGERLLIDHTDDGMDDVGVTQAIARVTKEWGPGQTIKDAWRHVAIHSESRWFTRIIDRMNCSSPEGQEHLRQCALSQAHYRIHFSTHTFSRAMEQTPKCDIHTITKQCHHDDQITNAAKDRRENNISQGGCNCQGDPRALQQELQVLGGVLQRLRFGGQCPWIPRRATTEPIVARLVTGSFETVKVSKLTPGTSRPLGRSSLRISQGRPDCTRSGRSPLSLRAPGAVPSGSGSRVPPDTRELDRSRDGPGPIPHIHFTAGNDPKGYRGESHQGNGKGFGTTAQGLLMPFSAHRRCMRTCGGWVK
ncbi:unnamed protein product [Phytophthora fragariaefolia]|uniref:Unnamed protein product n=1 Tax=Phytophthora fragariaefolia TaxID=1490495 RepID=A0A9W6XEA9_9STRA|nr:unnamed protein product [Phytophthora fragariaefolia]